MVRKKSLSKNSFLENSSKKNYTFPLNYLPESVKETVIEPTRQYIIHHPFHKKYKRLTATGDRVYKKIWRRSSYTSY